jgi:tetratricopeptide (TPR) repeat protein
MPKKVYRDTQEADATLYFNLAVLLEDLGRDDDAARFYREAIVHDAGMSDAHLNLSMLLERSGQMQSAYRHLSPTIAWFRRKRIPPTSPRYSQRKASILRRPGRLCCPSIHWSESLSPRVAFRISPAGGSAVRPKSRPIVLFDG